MIYAEYEKMWSIIRKMEKELFDLINERDELFSKTQPKATTLDKEKVDTSNKNNMMETYVIRQENYTKRINQLQMSLDDRYQALMRKREELRLSKNMYDKIYYLKYIEKLNIYKIASLTGYDRTSVWRHTKKIEKSISCNILQHRTRYNDSVGRLK